jgi:DNA-binding MarR family transcriptional regulator
MGPMMSDTARRVLELYPRIFFACHRRHLRDPKTAKVLSSHQVHVLDHLDDEQSMNLKDLAAHMGVTPATMCIAVDRLEAEGYVVRERDRVDARRVNLRLSRAGRRMRDAQSVLDPDVLESVLARLTPAERTAAVRGLALLAHAAQLEMDSKSHSRAH